MKNDGGPAFPTFKREHIYRDAHDRTGELQYIPKDGMSLRDHFAGQAMAGYIANSDGRDGNEPTPLWMSNPFHDLVELADLFYRMADAMLQAREK